MKIAVITDGNNQLGLGHIYQSITLVGYLLEKLNSEDEIYFITKSDENIVELLKRTNCSVFQYDDDGLIFEALKKTNPDKIIFDKLDVDPKLAKKIKVELKCKLIIFTNLTEANKFADMAVLADIGSNFKNVIKKNAKGQIQFFGPKYWILRPDFYYFKNLKKPRIEIVKNIMLIFGGSDSANLSTFVLDELLQMNFQFNIMLVLGLAFENHKDIEDLLDKNKASKSIIEIVKNIPNVAEKMYNSDVVFASPGLSFFESLVVGTPVLGFHQNQIQYNVYADVLPTIDKSELFKLPLFIKNKSFVFPSDSIIVNMEIGEGKDEIINEIIN